MLSGALIFSIIADEYPRESCIMKYILDNFELISQNEEHLDSDTPYQKKKKAFI